LQSGISLLLNKISNMYYIIVLGLVFSAIFLHQEYAGGVDAITKNINRRWLQITLQIILKTVKFCCVAIGILSMAIVMFA